jgi:hypothetical protein
MLDRVKRSERVRHTVTGRWMLYEPSKPEHRTDLLRIIFDRLKAAGRFQPSSSLHTDWETLERESAERFAIR